mmetsp:Transcript_59905/g.110973  ORF Transcript_59905/g.110973 Transcript_59905/m.110973 type:complete len:219 (+) Transcript_59905:578-1234(+)
MAPPIAGPTSAIAEKAQSEKCKEKPRYSVAYARTTYFHPLRNPSCDARATLVLQKVHHISRGAYSTSSPLCDAVWSFQPPPVDPESLAASVQLPLLGSSSKFKYLSPPYATQSTMEKTKAMNCPLKAHCQCQPISTSSCAVRKPMFSPSGTIACNTVFQTFQFFVPCTASHCCRYGRKGASKKPTKNRAKYMALRSMFGHSIIRMASASITTQTRQTR